MPWGNRKAGVVEKWGSRGWLVNNESGEAGEDLSLSMLIGHVDYFALYLKGFSASIMGDIMLFMFAKGHFGLLDQ